MVPVKGLDAAGSVGPPFFGPLDAYSEYDFLTGSHTPQPGVVIQSG